MEIEIHLVSEQERNFTIGWTPVPGCYGYEFYKDGKYVTRSRDPLKSTIRFSKPPSPSVYSVVAMMGGTSGDFVYPVEEPVPQFADPLMPLRGREHG